MARVAGVGSRRALMSKMHGVARISFRGGAVLMPAQTSYERELVFEQAEFCARRHGEATLELKRNEMLISAANPFAEGPCALCSHPLGPLVFSVGDRSLCPRCARDRKSVV